MSEQKIYPAMIAVMRSIGAIGKNQQNTQQRFNYRGIDDCYNALHAIMAKEGVFTTSEILARERQERTNKNGTVLAFVSAEIKYTFHAEDGSSVSTTVIGEGMDSGDKASNKAMAVAHKYALLQAFMIATDEQKDPDAETHEVVKYTQKDIDAAIRAADDAESPDVVREIWQEAKQHGYLGHVAGYLKKRAETLKQKDAA